MKYNLHYVETLGPLLENETWTYRGKSTFGSEVVLLKNVTDEEVKAKIKELVLNGWIASNFKVYKECVLNIDAFALIG